MLHSAETSLHASLHPSVRAVLHGQRLMLLDKIAKSLQNTTTRSLSSLRGRPVFPVVRVGSRVLSLLINFKSASMASGCRADVSLFDRTS